MIVKFHRRGGGAAAGAMDYLLGKNRDREDARLLRGDVDQSADLIDSLKFAKKYTSGVLSFAESDLPEADKAKIMDSFERALLPSLDADQYDVVWIEHRDKGRLELNFVIANVELRTGKRLQPYFDEADRRRVNAWAVVTRDEHGLTDPNEPDRKRALTLPPNLPRDRVAAAREITDGLLSLAAVGALNDRSEVVKTLNEAGYQVVRETKKSISIAVDGSDKNLRLTGAIYDRNYRYGSEIQSEVRAASERYSSERTQRIELARAELADSIEIKRAYFDKRYGESRSRDIGSLPEVRKELERLAAQRIDRDDGLRRDATADAGRSGLVVGSVGREERHFADSPGVEIADARSSGDRAGQERGRVVHSVAEGHDSRSEALGRGRPSSIENRGLDGDRDRADVVAECARIERSTHQRNEFAETLRRWTDRTTERVREWARELGKAGNKLVETARHIDRANRQLEVVIEQRNDRDGHDLSM